MKAILIILFLSIISSSTGFAQGKVLIVSRDTNGFKYGYPQRFESSLPLLQAALQKHYPGNVVTHAGLLPDSLEEFDAVFTDLRFVEEDDSVLIASETKKISAYLQTKGNLYIEVSDESTRQFPIDSTFNELVGLPKFGYASGVLKGVDEVVGIKGQFTDGLYYKRNTNPAEDNALYLLSLDGDVDEILRAKGGYSDQSIGWMHQNNKRKVVYHWLIVQEHYDEFIGRVVCNYFGLCEPLKSVSIAETTGQFSAVYDPAKQAINLHVAEDFHTIEVYSMLAIRLLTRPIDGESISISHSLPSGNYLVVARGAGRVEAKPVVIWR